MAKHRLFKVMLLGVAIVMAFSTLAACGGSDSSDSSGSSIPVPSGAERLGEENADADDIDAEDVDISNVKAVAYKVSGSKIGDVSDFYEDGVTDKGWTVAEHVAFGDLMLAVLHNDDDLVVATAMTGSAAREQGATELGELTVDLDDLADDDILILAATFTCNEESVDVCIDAMGLGI